MENPFVKLVREDEPSLQGNEAVDTSYDNQGDYWEAFALNKKGEEIPGTRRRLSARPEDGESLENEYRQFRNDLKLE